MLLGVLFRALGALALGCAVDAAHRLGRRVAGPDPRHTAAHGGRPDSRRDDRRAGRDPSLRNQPGPQERQTERWPAAHGVGHPVGIPVHRARLRRLRRAGPRTSAGASRAWPPSSSCPSWWSPISPRRPRTRCGRCRPATARALRPWACPLGYSLRKVVLKSALPGIVTGLLLALAIACGETAPLIYTANFSNTLPHSADARALPVPDLRGVLLLQRPLGPEALPRLRRRPDPGGDRVAAPGGQPHPRARTQRHSESAPHPAAASSPASAVSPDADGRRLPRSLADVPSDVSSRRPGRDPGPRERWAHPPKVTPTSTARSDEEDR